MRDEQGLWHFLLIEPFRWLFSYLFQPTAFKNRFEGNTLVGRFFVLLRFSYAIFLCCLPLTLAIRIALNFLLPTFYVYPLTNEPLRFLVDTLWSTALGAFSSIAGIFVVSVTTNVTLAIAVTVISGVLVDTGTSPQAGEQVVLIFSIAYGLVSGLLFGLTSQSNQGGGGRGAVSILVGALLGSIVGIAMGLFSGFLTGVLLGWLGGKVLLGTKTTEDALVATISAIVGAMTVGFVGSTIKSLARGSSGDILRAINVGRAIAILFGIFMGITGGVVGVLSMSRNILDQGYAFNRSFTISMSLLAGIVFLCSYLVGYYRLPLFPIAAFSAYSAYRAGSRQPSKIFQYLHYSALYWDERVFLPLPHLKDMLLLAAQQDLQRTLEEIAFIVAERPQQLVEARDAALTIALTDLEKRHKLYEIAQASQRLNELLLSELRQTNARWMHAITSLGDASRNAALCSSPISQQARQAALDEMIINLNRVRPEITFEDVKLNKRLQAVVKQWLATALQEMSVLKHAARFTSLLDNPYVSGPSLKLDDSSFVGRRDLVWQLEQSLSKGVNRPTFFLVGERRTGKTSTLNQLPRLLSARYLPIYYDLQLRGATASAAAFLSTVAHEVFEVMNARGLRMRKLDYRVLHEAARENAAAPYRVFDEWLRGLERILQQEDLTILLTFDEFEKLREAEAAHFLDLHLLLDWFRGVMQNRPRLALLFSGVLGLGEMGPNWSGYFVNTQVLKVGFLRKDEARLLITRPIPHYPSEQIFAEGVVEEVLRVTGGHPFLIQAVCSKLIDLLNIENRACAELPDVASAVEQVLENWWDTYFQDLWERTDGSQRQCLFVLKQQAEITLQHIAQDRHVEEHLVRDTLAILQRRDLVTYTGEGYQIATPIFQQWLQRHF